MSRASWRWRLILMTVADNFISDEKESAAVNGRETRPYCQQKSKEMRMSQKMRIISTQYDYSRHGFICDMFPFPPSPEEDPLVVAQLYQIPAFPGPWDLATPYQ
ncbi:hypothetical protein TURU_097479 [Turdus rufiventris]|nr:hypothetical protein TURU_097479 [Turdus rufiventris]